MISTKSNNTQKTVVLDTCFLIALYDKTSPFFKSAKTYHQYFLNKKIVMYIPTIVISEFNQLFTIAPIMETGYYQPLNFLYKDALAVGEVAFHLGLTNRSAKDSTDKKAEIKDDIKILGQAKLRNVSYLISSDDQIISRCLSLGKSGVIDCVPISIRAAFDSSLFSDNGQTNILDSVGA